MSTRLPSRPPQYVIDEIIIPNWDPSGAVGFDPTASPNADAFLPIATTIDDIGAVYPSLVISYSNETSGGETTYDFVTDDGPGQNRTGQLIATARAEDDPDGYSGDSAVYDPVDGETIVDRVIATVEDSCLENATADGTALSYVGSQPGADVPDDLESTPPVRMANCTIAYGWDRRP